VYAPKLEPAVTLSFDLHAILEVQALLASLLQRLIVRQGEKLPDFNLHLLLTGSELAFLGKATPRFPSIVGGRSH
jgi:hypothetical protein